MNTMREVREEHFALLDLDDCKVPIGCPWGADCPEDAFPDHWGCGIPQAAASASAAPSG